MDTAIPSRPALDQPDGYGDPGPDRTAQRDGAKPVPKPHTFSGSRQKNTNLRLRMTGGRLMFRAAIPQGCWIGYDHSLMIDRKR